MQRAAAERLCPADSPRCGIARDSRFIVSSAAQAGPDLTLDRLNTRRSLLAQLDDARRRVDATNHAGPARRAGPTADSLDRFATGTGPGYETATPTPAVSSDGKIPGTAIVWLIRREDSTHLGTLGCFLVDPAQLGTAYALTNFHVVSPPDVPGLAPDISAMGQPRGRSSVTGCCNDLFGKYAGGLLDLDDGIDEAVIRLDPGMQWQAEIADIGFVTGTHEITLAEVTSQRRRYPDTPLPQHCE